jgi:hypothetical protein
MPPAQKFTLIVVVFVLSSFTYLGVGVALAFVGGLDLILSNVITFIIWAASFVLMLRGIGVRL